MHGSVLLKSGCAGALWRRVCGGRAESALAKGVRERFGAGCPDERCPGERRSGERRPGERCPDAACFDEGRLGGLLHVLFRQGVHARGCFGEGR